MKFNQTWGHQVGRGVGEGIILFLLVIFYLDSAFSVFHIKAFFALTWNKFFDSILLG